MSETNNILSSVFSNKFITRTYCSILKKAFKKNQYYNLHYVENFEFRDGITFTGYIRKDVPLFGEFRKHI